MPRLSVLAALGLVLLAAGCLGLPGEDEADRSARALDDVHVADDAAGAEPDAEPPGADEDAEPADDSPGYPACRDPWPCGDGREWPGELVATEHPRQPPDLPGDLAAENGTVVAADAGSVRYRVVHEPEAPSVVGADATASRTTARVDVPAGLYLDLRATLAREGEDPAPPEDDAVVWLRVLDEDGGEVCSTSGGFGADADGYRTVPAEPCRAEAIQPRDERVRWTVEVEVRHHVAGPERVEATVALERATPSLRFDVRAPEPLPVPGPGDAPLEAYVWRPDVPEGVEVPVVVHASPYPSQCYLGARCFPSGDDPFWIERYNPALGEMARAGYAVVNLNVPGTGASGGCFDMTGPREAAALADAVAWLADRPWSNGRLGMHGLSYQGITPLITAAEAPEGLVTVLPAGTVAHWYEFYHTPQGAALDVGAPFHAAFTAGVGAYPPAGAPASAAGWLDVAPEQACPETAGMLARPTADAVAEDRDAAFYEPRNHRVGLANVSASVFLVHGLRDTVHAGAAHTYQTDGLWDALAHTPRRMVLGDWGHRLPDADALSGYPGGEDWADVAVEWLDFWLKGLGEPPRVGVVDHQDRGGQRLPTYRSTAAFLVDDQVAGREAGGEGAWHRSADWPPATAAREALYLADGELSPAPADGDAGFRAGPQAAETPYCGAEGTVARFESSTRNRPARLAGNATMLVNVTADQPGGLLAVDLYDLGPEAACEAGHLVDGAWLAGGAADLRYHDGRYAAEGFPTGEPTRVRVDLFDVAWTLEPGHRLALAVGGDGHAPYLRPAHAPKITLHAGSAGDSQLSLPLAEGTLGGDAPVPRYPGRPFQPD